MRVQNYCDGGNDKRHKLNGYHPPGCTCFQYNEERRAGMAAEDAKHQVAALDHLIEQERARLGTDSRAQAQEQGGSSSPPANSTRQVRPADSGRGQSEGGSTNPVGAFRLWVLTLGVVGSLTGFCLYTGSGGEPPLGPGEAPGVATAMQREPGRAVAPPTSAPSRGPTPAPTPPEAPELIRAKQLMLRLINDSRTHAGVSPVVMGGNRAAQIHAENSAADCFISHWGLDGSKPYMRYFLAGGYQSNTENVSGYNFCPDTPTGHANLRSIESEVRVPMSGLLNSPGHRNAILNSAHRKVNLGMAWNRYGLYTLQHFEGDYVVFERPPTFEGGVLRFKGILHRGATIEPHNGDRDLGLQISYDLPLQELTRGQLARISGYNYGVEAASLRGPAGRGYRYTSDSVTKCASGLNPWDIRPDALPPTTRSESHRLRSEAAAEAETRPCETVITVPWIDASRWSVKEDSFEVRVDVEGVLDRHGPGIYTIVPWANVDGKSTVVSEYLIFHETQPPAGYGPGGE